MRLRRSIPAGMERFMLFSPKKRRGLRRAAGRGALRFEKRPAQCRAAEKERAGEQNDRRAP